VIGTIVPGSTIIIGICALASSAHLNPSLSAFAWAPAHVFPGVLLGMAPNLAGLGPARVAILLIVGLIAVLAAGRALRSYLNRHPCPGSLRDRAALRASGASYK
jgi:membrane protein DedA with SNARE-associated domain